MDKVQNYKNHARLVPGYHYLLATLLLTILIGSVINLFRSSGGEGLYSASLLVANAAAFVLIAWYVRAFALRAQDRAIRAEENLRFYVRTGSPLDPGLSIRQIIGLRFASDEEYDALAARALAEGLSEDDIKKSIRQWRPDYYRV